MRSIRERVGLTGRVAMPRDPRFICERAMPERVSLWEDALGKPRLTVTRAAPTRMPPRRLATRQRPAADPLTSAQHHALRIRARKRK